MSSPILSVGGYLTGRVILSRIWSVCVGYSVGGTGQERQRQGLTAVLNSVSAGSHGWFTTVSWVEKRLFCRKTQRATYGTLSWACWGCLPAFLGLAGQEWRVGRSGHPRKRAWERQQQEGCPCPLAVGALKPGLWRSPFSMACSRVQGWGRGDEAAQAAVHFSPLVVPSGGCGVIGEGCRSLPSQKAALLRQSLLGERLLACGDQVCWFSLSRFSLCLFFIPPPVGMAEDFVREPHSQGQAWPQSAFIPISADGTALQLELGAARETQTTALAALTSPSKPGHPRHPARKTVLMEKIQVV